MNENIKSSKKTSKKVNLKSKVDKNRNKKSEPEIKTIKQNSIQVLNNELINILDQEGKLVPVERNGKRKKIVDWNQVLNHCCEVSWFTIEYLKEHVTSTYNKPKLYYSEALRVLDIWYRNKDIHITKKEISSGKYKNVYYKVERI